VGALAVGYREFARVEGIVDTVAGAAAGLEGGDLGDGYGYDAWHWRPIFTAGEFRGLHRCGLIGVNAMAGRPKSMAKKFGDLECELHELASCVFSEAQMRSANANDTLAVAWRHALDAVCVASVEMQRLGNLLRRRAGMNDLSPLQRLDAEMQANSTA
jgi:hypothetical protein